MLTDESLLAEIDAFLEEHKVAQSRFGLDAMADGALVPQLRAGRSLSLRNAEKVVSYMRSYTIVEPRP